MPYLLLADVLLVIHVAFVAFVVVGLLLVIVGRLASWSWVRNPWFRLAHLVCIAIVVVQSWYGMICPLKTWEMALRSKAGDLTYSGSFIAYWLNKILYYQAPMWVFAVVYTAFGLLVIASWYWVRPRSFGHNREHEHDDSPRD